MSEITYGSTPTKVRDVMLPEKPAKAMPRKKMSEMPGFEKLPLDDQNRIKMAEAKRARKDARLVEEANRAKKSSD